MENVHLNLDRRTGYVKGYALIEYARLGEAERAVSEANGTTLLDKIISVNFAFLEGPSESLTLRSKGSSGPSRRRSRSRSKSPMVEE